ncbi:salicylate hydroxylase [Kwoniella heveanensis CBS 569]|nr:salicylate hydroxylase [Kwoniella heveanensis CBS 569]
MTIAIPETKIRVAVVGTGPGGLAAIINLRKLPYVELSAFDQAKELREVGAGISINENTWRHLKLLGADEKLEQYTNRGDGSKVDGEQRNGITGELLARKYQKINPDAPPRSRIERYKLQRALLSQIPEDLIRLSKRLSKIEETAKGTTLTFEDRTTAGPFDLVIGADGLRSVVRQQSFPEHKLSYTGKVAYRTLIPQSAVAHIPHLPRASTFWHTKDTHVYTDFLDNGLFEIATRAFESDEEGNKVSWGHKVPREKVVHHYQGYCEAIRQVIATPDEWLEFAMFGGPRLESVISNGRIALLGDASHPLSGAFGSGAAFAFEDAYVLTKALEYTHSRGQPIGEALRLYDEVRSPHYKGLYAILNSFGKNAKEIEAISPPLELNELINETTRRNWTASNEWIYKYDVTQVWKEYLDAQEAVSGLSGLTLEKEKAIKEPTIPQIAIEA